MRKLASNRHYLLAGCTDEAIVRYAA